VNASVEVNTFIPALGYLYAREPTEIEVAHEPRRQGESKYSLYKLIRLNFDLMTGFSVVPLQLFSMLGMAVSASAGVLVLVLIWRRLFVGPEVEGCLPCSPSFSSCGARALWDRAHRRIRGRTYEQVRGRPRYIIAAVLDTEPLSVVRERERV